MFMTAVSKHSLGQYVQIAGLAMLLVGGILSLQHFAIGICFGVGAAAYYVGGRLKAA